MKVLEPFTAKKLSVSSTTKEARAPPIATTTEPGNNGLMNDMPFLELLPSDNHDRPFWQPPASTSVKLMATGATVGTVVDSLHNQILLEYHALPIRVPSLLHPDSASLLASSWTVPPLLAVAYLVLGGVLPRVVQKVQTSVSTATTVSKESKASPTTEMPMSLTTPVGGVARQENAVEENNNNNSRLDVLQSRALWAVATTAMIVKLSDVLARHADVAIPGVDVDLQHLVILFTAALFQWWTLDGTAVALILAAVTAYGGPLAELPFISANVWTYLPDAANYLPMEGNGIVAQALRAVLGQDSSSLAISYLSAPCYFAVTMDAIALGRWFDAQQQPNE